jgi:RNA-directed DNA polymerase
MKEARSKSQEWLIETLNPIIRGWAFYHRHSAAKATFSRIDHIIWSQLWSWLHILPDRERGFSLNAITHSP